MFKAKLIIPIVALMSFMIVVKSNAQERNNTLSVISVENLTTDKDPVSKIFTLYLNEKTEFANVTKIKFDLYKDANVILNVIDKQGEIVENLIDGSMQPGNYGVYFKSKDEIMPDELSYKIEVNGESDSILIIK